MCSTMSAMLTTGMKKRGPHQAGPGALPGIPGRTLDGPLGQSSDMSVGNLKWLSLCNTTEVHCQKANSDRADCLCDELD